MQQVKQGVQRSSRFGVREKHRSVESEYDIKHQAYIHHSMTIP